MATFHLLTKKNLNKTVRNFIPMRGYFSKRNFGFLGSYMKSAPQIISNMFETKVTIKHQENQQRQLAEYAVNFLKTDQFIDEAVYEKVKLFHTDAVL
jgi:hypothetical protein